MENKDVEVGLVPSSRSSSVADDRAETPPALSHVMSRELLRNTGANAGSDLHLTCQVFYLLHFVVRPSVDLSLASKPENFLLGRIGAYASPATGRALPVRATYNSEQAASAPSLYVWLEGSESGSQVVDSFCRLGGVTRFTG